MREDFISGIRNLFTSKEEERKELNLNSLGYLNVIGFSPSMLKKGKKLYSELITYITENHILDKYTPESVETNVMERLVLYVHQNKWKQNRISDSENIENQLVNEQKQIQNSVSQPKLKSNLPYGSVEYGIIDKKVKEERPSDKDLKLINLFNEFNNWVKEYLKHFSYKGNQQKDLVQLVKLIVSK